jgi:hypothetical protein
MMRMVKLTYNPGSPFIMTISLRYSVLKLFIGFANAALIA